ncbi:MAG: SufD family Fe-S cluster assembly protein [Alphaproteobacteria bacterium]|nr:SufD family Fe-S cluster assembly protein [Alphaproteobacteria bacterium]MBV9692788.1 SufD family Fe-S cluster assembly protein [Alphaproteobacteria bacterium]
MNVALDARRLKAAEEFRAAGVPHRRMEAWKYSDLRPLIDAEQVASAPAAQWSIEAEGVELFDPAAGEGAFAGIMGEASLAFATATLGLRVKAAGRVRIAFATPGQARLRIVLDDGARLDYVESAPGGGLQNIGTEIVLGRGARMTHARLAQRAGGARIGDVSVTVAEGGCYRLHCADFGSDLSRLELDIKLRGIGAQAHLSGTSVLAQGLHADVTTHVDHAAGDTCSTQLFKLVAADKARAVYQGRITVRQGADGSDSRQTAKGLLLAERAEIDLKPELEIFADEVKCAHGAAVGDLDADSLFYLRSRGIADDEARALLIRAFLAEPLDEVEDEAMRAALWAAIEDALPGAMGQP